MQLVQIHTQPDPYSPFLLSQAIRAGQFIFLSGQAGADDDGNIVGAGDFEAQTRQAIKNLDRVLTAAGLEPSHIVKLTIFLVSIDQAPTATRLLQAWLSKSWPAVTIIEVAALYTPEAKVEIEAVAAFCD